MSREKIRKMLIKNVRGNSMQTVSLLNHQPTELLQAPKAKCKYWGGR